jgi:hypothetical protein
LYLFSLQDDASKQSTKFNSTIEGKAKHQS